jgi:hypothetical protein
VIVPFAAFSIMRKDSLVKTANPILVSISEAGFQLSLPPDEIDALVRDGELVAVPVRGRVLIVYESLRAFTRRTLQDTVVRRSRLQRRA